MPDENQGGMDLDQLYAEMDEGRMDKSLETTMRVMKEGDSNVDQTAKGNPDGLGKQPEKKPGKPEGPIDRI